MRILKFWHLKSYKLFLSQWGIKKLMGFLQKYFSKSYPSKRMLFLNKILIWTSITLGSFVIFLNLLSVFNGSDDSSYTHLGSFEDESYRESLSNAHKEIKGDPIELGFMEEDVVISGDKIDAISDTTPKLQKNHSDLKPKSATTKSSIKYRGKQVFLRRGILVQKVLPKDTHMIGKLVSSIDTRVSGSSVRVQLPFGAKFKGYMGLPPDTLLFGTFSYSGQGKRVFIEFQRAILPDGQEKKVEAVAKDVRDFSHGLIGTYHSAFKERMGATMGMSFLSEASRVLQDKEALGWGKAAPKPTVKNALLGGVSQALKTEGNLQLEEIRSRKQGAYITLKSGRELIVSLSEAFGTREVKP